MGKSLPIRLATPSGFARAKPVKTPYKSLSSQEKEQNYNKSSNQYGPQIYHHVVSLGGKDRCQRRVRFIYPFEVRIFRKTQIIGHLLGGVVALLLSPPQRLPNCSPDTRMQTLYRCQRLRVFSHMLVHYRHGVIPGKRRRPAQKMIHQATDCIDVAL